MKVKVLLIIVLVFCAHSAHAEIIINEVKLSPTADRFIELYNNSSSAVNLTDWYMQRKTATGSTFGSLVTKTQFAGKSIGANDYFVISKSSITNSDLVVEDLTLTESNTIQIKNADGGVIYKLGWGSSNDCASPCPSNPGEGQSLFRNSLGSWVTGTTTPGAANEASSDASTTTSSGPGGAVQAKPVEQKMKLEIKNKPLAFPGVPVKFEAAAYGLYGEQLIYGKYFWNFGDGDYREADASYTPEKFTHIYAYPGEYTVLLEYYKNYFSGSPDLTKEVVITVLAADMAISEVGTESDFFIEVSNLTKEDADISGWYLTSGEKQYMFPKNTTIKKDKKLRVSPKLTKFTYNDRYNLMLRNSQWGIVFDYGKTVQPAKITPIKTSKISSVVEMVQPEEFVQKENEPLSSLLAAPIEAKAIDTSYLPTLIFVGFLGLSSSALYVLRRNKSETEDFELLDE